MFQMDASSGGAWIDLGLRTLDSFTKKGQETAYETSLLA